MPTYYFIFDLNKKGAVKPPICLSKEYRYRWYNIGTETNIRR